MSEKKKDLGSFINSVRAGLNNINEHAKAKVEGKHKQALDESHDAPDDGQLSGAQTPPLDKRIEPDMPIDDFDIIQDAEIIEGESQPVPEKKGLSMKHKVLLLCVLVVCAGAYQSFKSSAPTPEELASSYQPHEGNQQQDGGDYSNDNDALEIDFSIDDSQSPGQSDLSFSIDDSGDVLTGLEPITAEQLNENIDNTLDALQIGNIDTIDPFTGELTPNKPTDSSIPALAEVTTDTFGDNVFDSIDELKIEGTDKYTELAGNAIQNADSGLSVLNDQAANADFTALKPAHVSGDKDVRIGKLEGELEQLKSQLAKAEAKAKSEEKARLAAEEKAKASPQVQAAAKPVQQRQAPAAQRSTPVAKAVPRPQFCVTAIAQAARNCTTCVPHAFITHTGVESMVGHGDYLEGLRVSISGDRLDLQNAQGVVVHKFWSNPNGCVSG